MHEEKCTIEKSRAEIFLQQLHMYSSVTRIEDKNTAIAVLACGL
jgi:hypothetical protein